MIFDRPKPEEAKIRQLFAPTMDNVTGKETAVLIMIIIDPICMMIHISGYFTYPAMVWSSLASQTHFRKRGKGLVNSVYKPCPTRMQIAG